MESRLQKIVDLNGKKLSLTVLRIYKFIALRLIALRAAVIWRGARIRFNKKIKNRLRGAIVYYWLKLFPTLCGATKLKLSAMQYYRRGYSPASGGLRQIIRLLPNMVDLSECLNRHTRVPKSAGV